MKFRIIPKVILFLAIFVGIFCIIDYFLGNTVESTGQNREFHDPDTSYDVLFFGSSHMDDDVQPIELWHDYGITSFNMGVNGEHLAATAWNLKLALNEKHPKLVVIDVYKDYPTTSDNYRPLIHKLLDQYPISELKYEAVKALAPDPNKKSDDLTLDNFIEFLSPFSMYHSNWNRLAKKHFKPQDYLKGSSILTAVATPGIPLYNYASTNTDAVPDKSAIPAIYDIINTCREHDVQLLFVYLPHIANQDQITIAKQYAPILEEEHVPYLNFLEHPFSDPYTDFFNSSYKNSHLNIAGAKKFTAYLGKYLQENYHLEDHRGDNAYAFWDSQYQEYLDYKVSLIKENKTKLKDTLAILYDEPSLDFNFTVSSEDNAITRNDAATKLLQNLHPAADNYRVDNTIFINNYADKTVKLVVKNARTDKKIEEVYF